MWKHGKRIFRKSIRRSSRGATLVEVVIAIVVLSLITASVPPVLIMLNNSQFRWNEQTVAESLVRTQIEYIKGCPYVYGNATMANTEYYKTVLDTDGNMTVLVPDEDYRIDVIARPVVILPAPTPSPMPSPAPTPIHQYVDFIQPGAKDLGMQEITVEVYHLDKLVLSVKSYKVDR